MTTKEEYNILDYWKDCFCKSEIVKYHKKHFPLKPETNPEYIDWPYETIFLNKDVYSALFFGRGPLVSKLNISSGGYDNQFSEFDLYCSVNGIEEFFKFRKYFELIGIEFTEDFFFYIASKGYNHIKAFLQKGYYFFSNILQYDKKTYSEMLYNNFGDLKFYAQQVLNFDEGKKHSLVNCSQKIVDNFSWVALQRSGEKKYLHVYFKENNDNLEISFKENSSQTRFIDVSDSFLNVLDKISKTVKDHYDHVLEYLLSSGYKKIDWYCWWSDEESTYMSDNI